jgi:DNA-binding response OmpR family regulator
VRALLVDDDPAIGQVVCDALGRADFGVELVGDAHAADAILRGTEYDLVILDIGLPGMDGFDLLQRLRRRGSRVPVMMLTARDALDDRVRGLNQGADDYLVKPFQLPELIARAHALVRRGRSAMGAVLGFGPLSIDTEMRQARLGDQPLSLTGREWDLLVQLVLSAPKVVAKNRIVDSLSRWDDELTANAVEIHVSRLRNKIADRGIALRTVRGLGYRLEIADAPRA